MTDQERQLIKNIQTHDLAESLRLRRAKEAKEASLPAEAFSLPFPGNQTVHIHKTESSLAGKLLPPLVGLLLGGGLTAGLSQLWQSRTPVEPVELEIKVWNDQGEWKWEAQPVKGDKK